MNSLTFIFTNFIKALAKYTFKYVYFFLYWNGNTHFNCYNNLVQNIHIVQDVLHKFALIWKLFSGRECAMTVCEQSLGLCYVKIRKVRGRKCVPVAYIIALFLPVLLSRSSYLCSFMSSVRSRSFSHSLSSTLPPEDSLFRVLFTHNHVFACKLDITT